jgi:diketogulonate reductase-like aldo/keto reductase
LGVENPAGGRVILCDEGHPMESTITLRTGASMPRLGLGVFRASSGEETQRAVIEAIAAGYRHIDTAKIYGNERDVGEGIRRSGIPRSEIFVTTKLWNADQGFNPALRAFDASLDRLGLDYVDLYLVHWPVPKARLDSWRALEDLFGQKRARAIGVSNFMVRHLEELVAHARVPPAVNQIEVSPFLQQRAVREWCKAYKVVVEAYSPLTKGTRLNHPVVAEVARASGMTPAQVLLRWGLQHNLVILPKSTHGDRIRENGLVFGVELSAKQMAQLDALEEGLVTGWDPRDQP